MSIFGRQGNSPTKLANIRITQSVQGNPLAVVMGCQRIQQALLWMGGISAKKEAQGGKGGGKGGSFYLYSADVLAALCAGPVTGIGDVWSGQSWLNSTRAAESITIASVYAPANAVLLLTDNGVAIANTYSQSYTDYGAPAATVLSGSDLSSLIQVPYGTSLTTGHYSINPASIGTFALTAAANASGGNTVYTGTLTGGASPYGSGASNAYVGFRFIIAGFANAVNNGTFVCVASTATTITLANAAGVAETIAATAIETGNTYHFAAADVGKSAIINYQFHLQSLLAQELDLVPASKVITVGGTFTPITDLGVRYYNPGGVNDGVALTPVTGTPSVAGTYKFHDNGSGGGATYTFATADIHTEVRIKYGFQDNAAVAQDAPTTLNFELIGGAQSQSPWSTLTSKYPQAALGYTKTALVGYAPMDLGSSAQAQDNTFEVITPDAFGGGIIDCNVVKCIFRVLTDTAWGLGSGLVPFPVLCIDNGSGGTWGGAAGTPGARVSDSSAWNWFAAHSFFISPILDSQGSAANHIGKWLEAGMCAAFMSEGLLKLVPYGDTSAAGNGCTWIAPQNFVVALDDSCFLGKQGEDPVKIQRQAWQDAYNEVQIQWNNRSNQYAPEVTPDFDQAAINRFGLRIEDPQTWDFICTLPAATFAANLRVKRGVNIRNTYTFRLPFTYSYLEPMDIVTISTSSVWAAGQNNVNLGINNLPVRITKIVDDPIDGLTITAEDYPWGTHQPVLFNKGISAGDVLVNMFEQPGDTETVIFEAPSRLTGFQGYQVWIGAIGKTDKWGGCNVWVSLDGTKYQLVGTIEAPARLGTLAVAFGQDVVSTLALATPALTSGTTLTAAYTAGNSVVVPGDFGFDVVVPLAGSYLLDVLLWASDTSSKPNGYFFRFDSRSTQNAGTIYKVTAGVWTVVSTAVAAANAGNLPAGTYHVRCQVKSGGVMNIYVNGVLQSTATDATYTPTGATYYGYEVTAPSIAQTRSDPDQVSTLVVNLAENSLPLESGTAADADNRNTLSYVDGEIIAFSSAEVTGQNQFTADGYIRRGNMSSAISLHPAGSAFLRLDNAVFKYTYDPALAGKIIYFKFQSINSFGNMPQDLSTLTAVTLQLPGANPSNVPAQTTDVMNADFEISSELPPFGWLITKYSGGLDAVVDPGLDYDTTTQYAGARSLKFTSVGLSESLYSAQTFVVRPGDQYQLAAALIVYSGGAGIQIALECYNAAGGFIGFGPGCQRTLGTWAIVSSRGFIPANATQARLVITSTAGAVVGGIDAVNLVRKTDLIVADSQIALTANYNSGSAKTLVSIPAAGAVYKISGAQAINRAASTSSTMPSLTLSYTDAGGVVRTVVLVATSAANATSVVTNFSLEIHADSAAAITLTSAGYASSGATSMKYSLGYTLSQVA